MLLFDELSKKGNTIIVVTHEDFIAQHTNRIIKLRDGLIEEDYPNESILNNNISKDISEVKD